MTKHKYTPEQKEFIKNNACGIGNKELTELFNKQFGTTLKTAQLKGFKANHKISSGLTGHFTKGHTPVNKGKTWNDYMPENSQKKSLTTCFVKGNIPLNRKPIGSERIDKKDGYTYVKVQDGQLNDNWKAKHVILWEKHNGKIPEGYKIIFLNRDKTDIRIDNLALVSSADLLVMNRQGLIHKDEELTKTGANIAKLINATSKATKRSKENRK